MVLAAGFQTHMLEFFLVCWVVGCPQVAPAMKVLWAKNDDSGLNISVHDLGGMLGRRPGLGLASPPVRESQTFQQLQH